jgi:hypothetical protein
VNEPVAVTPPTCGQCGRPWFNEGERWRSYLDDEEEPRLYCSGCAEREFADA